MKILLGITGASGSIYGIRLLEELKAANVEVHLIISEGSENIITHETSYKIKELIEKSDFYYDNNNLSAPPASGSFQLDAKEFLKIIEGEGNHYLEDMICANVGLAMICHDNSLSIQNGINEARRSIRTGTLKRKVTEYTELSKRIRKN